ncbi:MAG: hypothetical protein K0Q59_3662 [Paenibacillus sp.]|nr:hypothetical protein [Paenibacillus sp.]
MHVPAGWSGPGEVELTLAPGETYQWNAAIQADGGVEAVNRLEFCWKRTHAGYSWSEERVPFTLVRASRWSVSGPDGGEAAETVIPGNRLSWSRVLDDKREGIYKAETTMNVPSDRTMRLIAAANCPVKVRLDGKEVIACADIPQFMPAFHRAPAKQLAELEIAAGSHTIEVEATGGGQPLEVFVLPISVRQNVSPGSFYYYTDVTWGS